MARAGQDLVYSKLDTICEINLLLSSFAADRLLIPLLQCSYAYDEVLRIRLSVIPLSSPFPIASTLTQPVENPDPDVWESLDDVATETRGRIPN